MSRKSIILRLLTPVLIGVILFVLPLFWGWSGLPYMIIFVLLLGTILLVRWHARNTGYCCPECGYIFVITAWTDFMSPHLAGKKMLRCPKCGQSGWCVEINRDSIRGEEIETAVRDASTIRPVGSLYIQIMVIMGLYFILCLYTFFIWSRVRDSASITSILRIPLAIAILPALHAGFCLFAARRGYKSRIYLFITSFVGIFLALAIWIQYLSFAN